MNASDQVSIRRSMLGRARGRGAARAGFALWWTQRVTAVALVPLTLWFISAIIGLESASRSDVVGWLHSPLALALMLSLIVATFWHMAIGLGEVIADYVHGEGTKLAALLAVRGLSVLLALLCAIAALRLGL